MTIKLVNNVGVILFTILLFTILSSCISKQKQENYIIAIDEKLLTDSFPLIESMIKFKCSDCPGGMGQEYKRFIVPSKNSKLFIYNDSSRIGKFYDIYNYNVFETFAGSTPSPLRYFKNINKLLNKGLINIPGKSFLIDSLLKAIKTDSSYVVFTNAINSTAFTKSTTGSLNQITESLFQYATRNLAKDNNYDPSVFVYIESGLTILPPVTDFNPKKEIYQSMRLFYERLEVLYKNEFSLTEKEAKKNLIKDSFRPGAIIEIQNNDEKDPTKYTIDKFLDRITSDKRFQYDDVSFFMDKFSFFLEPEPKTDSDIPGTLKGSASYDQHFKGSNKGVVVYQDVVNKNVNVSLEPISVSRDGNMVMGYKFLIESITVNYVN